MMHHIQRLESAHSDTGAFRSAPIPERNLYELLVQWNQTEADYPRKCCLHNLFEQQVTRTPDRVAACFEVHQLTYSEPNARANQVANYLIRFGVGPEVMEVYLKSRGEGLVTSTKFDLWFTRGESSCTKA